MFVPLSVCVMLLMVMSAPSVEAFAPVPPLWNVALAKITSVPEPGTRGWLALASEVTQLLLPVAPERPLDAAQTCDAPLRFPRQKAVVRGVALVMSICRSVPERVMVGAVSPTVKLLLL